MNDVQAILRQTLVSPVEAGRAILAINPDMGVRWTLLAAAILVGVVVAYLLPVMTGMAEEVPSPVTMVALQLAINLVAIGLMTGVGRALGGQGGFADALWLMGWFQLAMLALQVVQLVIVLILPGMAFVLATLTIGLFFWILTGYICALHGFQSQVLVLLGIFVTVVSVAVVVMTSAPVAL